MLHNKMHQYKFTTNYHIKQNKGSQNIKMTEEFKCPKEKNLLFHMHCTFQQVNTRWTNRASKHKNDTGA